MRSREVSHSEVVAWLRAYNGKQGFFYSLKYQLQKRGYLTPKQAYYVKQAILSGMPVERPTNQIENPTYASGTVLEIKEATARIIAEDHGLPFSFPLIEVIKTHKESEKGIQLTFRARSLDGQVIDRVDELTTWVCKKSVRKK